MQEITHINVNGVTYALAGSNSGGGVTIFTPEGAGTPIPVSGLIENIYFNTSLSTSEVHAIIDEALIVNAPISEIMEQDMMYVVYASSASDMTMVAIGRMPQGYIIAANLVRGDVRQEEVVYVDGALASTTEVSFVGWNPNMTEISVNATNMLDVLAEHEFGVDPNIMVAVNEVLASLISTESF